MKRFIAALFLAGSLWGAVPEEIPAGFRPFFEKEPQLFEGNARSFDECSIAVGSAAVTPGKEALSRLAAAADARARLARLLAGAELQAARTVSEELALDGDKAKQQRSVIETVRVKISDRQTRIEFCGEWFSDDGTRIHVAVALIYRDFPRGTAQVPDGIRDWKVERAWESSLLGVSGILKGGAALTAVADGRVFVITVGDAPASAPQREILMHRKAMANAAGYVNGALIADIRNLRSIIREEADEGGEFLDISQKVTRHSESTVSGGIRMAEPIGSWSTADGKRSCKAYAIPLKDIVKFDE